MFIYQVNDVMGDCRLGNTDIFESSGYSAAHIIYIVRALLEKYEIDICDSVYSARSNKEYEK